MRLLLIGNPDSFLVIRLAQKLKQEYDQLTIDILSYESNLSLTDAGVFDNIFVESEKRCFADRKFIKVIFLALRFRRLLRRVPSGYDAVGILYVSSVYSFGWRLLRSKSHRVVATVFGSEFYRSGWLNRQLLRKPLRNADLLTATNEQTLTEIVRYYKVQKNGELCRFGLSILDEIDKVTAADEAKFRSAFQLKPTDRIVACGYNASENQNIPEIVESLVGVKERLSDLVFFFQFPRPMEVPYTKLIIERMKDAGLNFRVIDNRPADSELAVYRKSVEVMIQVQTTDQLSGAMQEHLYAGCKVITGNWLPYKVFDDLQIDYWKVNDRNALGDRLLEVLGSNCDQQRNREAIASLSKWERVINGWGRAFFPTTKR